jgi:hypothetical protein
MPAENPIIVFVIPGMIGKQTEDFPIGWPMDGTCASPLGQTPVDLSVLMLDDGKEVSDVPFANRDCERPLLVVAHNGSTRNNAAEIMKNPILASWGRPYICDTFSHQGDGSAWSDIQSLLAGSLDAVAFVTRRALKRHLDSCERLAASCQLKVFHPSAEITNEVKQTREQLPDELNGQLFALLNRKQPDWIGMINLILEYAGPLAR